MCPTVVWPILRLVATPPNVTDETRELVRRRKRSIAQAILAGEEIGTQELLSLHRLEVAIQNADLVKSINERSRKVRHGDSGTKAQTGSSTPTRGKGRTPANQGGVGRARLRAAP